MWKRLVYGLPILLGIAGFCAIPFIVGVEDLLLIIGQVGLLCIVLFTVNASCTLLMPAVGWWLLMRAEGIPASLGTAIKANLMGFPLNVMTPSMYLGGEPLKIMYLSRIHPAATQQVLATMIVSKFQEFGGLALSMIAVTALFVWHTDYFTKRNAGLLILASVLLAGMLGMTLYAFVGRFKPIVTLIAFLGRFGILQRHMARLQTLAAELEDLIYEALATRVRTFLLAQAITCLSAVSVFLRPWIFFQFVPGVTVGFDQLCLLFALTNVVNAFTIVPGSLGLFEGTMTAYTSTTELGDDRGAAFALVTRIADLTLFMIGSWLIVHYLDFGHLKWWKRAERVTSSSQALMADDLFPLVTTPDHESGTGVSEPARTRCQQTTPGQPTRPAEGARPAPTRGRPDPR